MQQQQYTNRRGRNRLARVGGSDPRVACVAGRSQLCSPVWFSLLRSLRTPHRFERRPLFGRKGVHSFGPRAWSGAHTGVRGRTALLLVWLPWLGLWQARDAGGGERAQYILIERRQEKSRSSHLPVRQCVLSKCKRVGGRATPPTYTAITSHQLDQVVELVAVPGFAPDPCHRDPGI